MGSKHFEKEKSKRNSTESQRPSYIRLTNADSVVPFKALSVRGINNRIIQGFPEKMATATLTLCNTVSNK